MEIINFSAGPSALIKEVLKTAQDELLSYQEKGFSIVEISHRSPTFENILNEAKQRVKDLYNINDDYEVLFLQGGASLQFAQIPMNLYKNKIEFIDSGVWTNKAINEAKILNLNYNIIASSKDKNYSYIPKVNFNDDIDYGYICSNNTIYGTQFKEFPKSSSPLVIDASSDFFSKELDFSNIGILFGGAQKNCGVSGVTIVIIKKDLIRDDLNLVPTLLRYKTQADLNSMANTPNTFGIYILNLTMKWIQEQGGLNKINEINKQKAALLYNTIDNSNGFYEGYSVKEDRSIMNICFKIFDKSLEAVFIKNAEENGMIGLKGHKHLGGIRASLYNAIELNSVEKLNQFMKEFITKFS